MNSPLKAERPGLCITCNNASDCVYRLKRGFDALYCETYDYYSPSIDNGKNELDTEPIKTSVAPLQNLAKGLCSNCDNFKNCLMPKPEEGVWHCEEYI